MNEEEQTFDVQLGEIYVVECEGVQLAKWSFDGAHFLLWIDNTTPLICTNAVGLVMIKKFRGPKIPDPDYIWLKKAGYLE